METKIWLRWSLIILLLIIVFVCLGATCPWLDKDDDVSSGSSGDDIVYITETGSKYHKAGCQYLSQSKIPISRQEAIRLGYPPCSVCNP